MVSVGKHGINTITPAKNFTRGDLALIDLRDDATIQEGDCAYFKRSDKRSVIPTPDQSELAIYGNEVMDLTSSGLRSI
jgi:hypothetical protein